jgi:hypothetical protein
MIESYSTSKNEEKVTLQDPSWARYIPSFII